MRHFCRGAQQGDHLGAPSQVAQCFAVHHLRFYRAPVFGSVRLRRKSNRLRENIRCLFGTVLSQQSIADRAHQLRCHTRPSGEFLFHAKTRGLEQLHRSGRGPGARVGVGALEYRQGEALDLFGTGSFQSRLMGLPKGHCSPSQQRDDGYRDGRRLPAIARDPLFGPIAQGVRPRRHRSGSHVPLDVRGKRVNGRVAQGCVFLQRFGKNGVQVALLAGGPTDHVGDLGGQCGAATRGQFIGTRPCQDFVTDNTQAIHVAGGSNGLAANLFRTCIVGGKGPGPLGLGVTQLLAQEPGDAEVEQMCPALVADQNIGRLDVAMNDQTGVGVLNRFEHLQQELQSLTDRQIVRFAVLRDRHTVNEFEGEIRFAAIRDARVVESGDVGVFEAGENVALLNRPFGKRSYPTDMRPLQGDGALDDAVDPFSEPDTAHAAFADVAQESIRTDLRAGQFRRQLGV